MLPIKCGEIYFKKGSVRGKLSRSSDGHYVVVLGVDVKFNVVLYQTLESGLDKVFTFPRASKPPFIDVDAVSFLNYRKYQNLLHKDTCIMMHYGVDMESLPVFLSPRYRKCGVLSEHNKKALMVSLIPARMYKLSNAESLLISHAYQNLR
jgi:hypothetical protein